MVESDSSRGEITSSSAPGGFVADLYLPSMALVLFRLLDVLCHKLNRENDGATGVQRRSKHEERLRRLVSILYSIYQTERCQVSI